MNPSKSYIQLLAHLKEKFSDNPKRHVRLLGLVFCRPDNKLAREEILPSLAYYHNRSGKNIDFYFPGFDSNAPRESSDVVVHSGIPSKSEWVFNLKSFGDFQEQIESETSWRYSGGSDFMLVNCHYDDKGEPHLDFDGAVILTLEELRRQNRLPDVGIFFEKIFRHCEQFEQSDEAWGCGLDAVPGSALMGLCNSFLTDAGGVKPVGVVPSGEPVIEVDSKESAPQAPDLITRTFRYDLGTRSLIIMEQKRKLIVPIQFAEVMNQIFKREPGLYAIRASHLDCLNTAMCWENGKMKRDCPSISDRQLMEKLRPRISNIKKDQKKLSQEFRRQFSDWLRENGIEANSVIMADRRNGGYKLGVGWHPNRMVINDSEVGINYAKPYDDNIDSEEISGMKTRHMGTAC